MTRGGGVFSQEGGRKEEEEEGREGERENKSSLLPV